MNVIRIGVLLGALASSALAVELEFRGVIGNSGSADDGMMG
ncbi:MAG TPA: hypothetical protein VM186_10465 [Planctomycetota bacterium]|nr:hypothetical protein [Planctomycetota bacterium]